jgi:hypothetical protein
MAPPIIAPINRPMLEISAHTPKASPDRKPTIGALKIARITQMPMPAAISVSIVTCADPA